MSKNISIFLLCAGIFEISDTKPMKRIIDPEEKKIQLLFEVAKKTIIYKEYSHAQWANIDHHEKSLREQKKLLAELEETLANMKNIARDIAKDRENQNINLLFKIALQDLENLDAEIQLSKNKISCSCNSLHFDDSNLYKKNAE